MSADEPIRPETASAVPQPPAPPAPPVVPGQVAPPAAPGFPAQAPGQPTQPPTHAAQAPGYAAPAPGYPAGVYPAAPPPRGLLPWALGLLILVPFPFVGGLASGIAMAVSGGASRRSGGVAAENARVALNWGLTYLLVSTVLVISHFVLLFALSARGPIEGFFPFGTIITIYFALSVLHVVLVIVGMVRASAGKVMRIPFAIPFLRR
ncbi:MULTISPECIES: DUF4870 domain-containing protein [unclassified Microbacterium]|uniref:DUF4870 domain-containing protein n=1 Tax=unclassified Microbacterium TaxID=2609290 RepID=UPI00343364BD